MNIRSVRAANFPNRVHVEFDSGLMLPMLVDDVVVLKLSKGLDIDDEFFKQIVYKSVYYLLRNSAMIQINNSPKTEKLLAQKLRISLQKIKLKHDYPAGLIDYSGIITTLCSDLKDKGLLSDVELVTCRREHGTAAQERR